MMGMVEDGVGMGHFAQNEKIMMRYEEKYHQIMCRKVFGGIWKIFLGSSQSDLKKRQTPSKMTQT